VGWIDKLTATHRDRRDFAGASYGFLPGWEAKPFQSTAAGVVWPEILPGGVAHVDISVPGVAMSKFHRCIVFEPPEFEASFLSSTIVAPDVVRLLAANDTDAPITPTTRDWPRVYRFARRATGR
jgi:hypothetical protein